ncbi:hypothetical protein YC2023_094613 [Brassica napus]
MKIALSKESDFQAQKLPRKTHISHSSYDPISYVSSHRPNSYCQTNSKRKKRKEMASTSAVSLFMPLTQNRSPSSTKTVALRKPLLPLKPSKASSSSLAMPSRRFQVNASNLKMEKAVSGLAAAALTVSMVIPEVAEAAGSGVSPSLKNFLLSIAAGGVVLTVIIGVVVGVSNFDPVKRG